MKVKELFEDKKPEYAVYVWMAAPENIQNNRSLNAKVKNKLKLVFPNINESAIEFDSEMIEVLIDIDPIGNSITREQCEKIYNKCADAVNPILEAELGQEMDMADFDLRCYGYPQHMLQCDEIKIFLREPTSISTLKNFIDCEDILVINNCERISGGLLSLLQVKAAGVEFHSRDGSRANALLEIFDHHFKGDKNASALQTELMKNGFKAMATK